MRFAVIAKHRHIRPVNWLCEALGLHAWLTRPVSAHAVADERLLAEITRSFHRSDRTYRACRVWHDVLAEGFACGLLHRVERLMRLHGLRARPRRRGLPKDNGARSVIADNLLDPNLHASRPSALRSIRLDRAAPRREESDGC